MAADIRITYAKDICIGSIYAIGTWIKCADIMSACTECIYTSNVFVKDVEPKTLVESEVILAGLGINNYCFQLSIRLTFTSIEKLSCWGK